MWAPRPLSSSLPSGDKLINLHECTIERVFRLQCICSASRSVWGRRNICFAESFQNLKCFKRRFKPFAWIMLPRHQTALSAHIKRLIEHGSWTKQYHSYLFHLDHVCRIRRHQHQLGHCHQCRHGLVVITLLSYQNRRGRGGEAHRPKSILAVSALWTSCNMVQWLEGASGHVVLFYYRRRFTRALEQFLRKPSRSIWQYVNKGAIEKHKHSCSNTFCYSLIGYRFRMLHGRPKMLKAIARQMKPSNAKRRTVRSESLAPQWDFAWNRTISSHVHVLNSIFFSNRVSPGLILPVELGPTLKTMPKVSNPENLKRFTWLIFASLCAK